jgi:hypothetical protein
MKLLRLLSVIVSTLLLPAFAVFLLWRLQFIKSIFLRTQRERIIPYAIAIIFYFWVWNVFNNLSDSPLAAKQFLLGVFLSVCAAWMANIWSSYCRLLHIPLSARFTCLLSCSLQDWCAVQGSLWAGTQGRKFIQRCSLER